jgi:pSer/pThr/pTyr-binding forkhead associated (FHA) protein
MPKTGFKFMLVIKSGPDQGATFQLLPPRVTIGRGADNNIALTDPRMSRNSAVIEFSMEKITLTDVSGRSSLMVNGEICIEASLKDGDRIMMGDTEISFVVEAMQLSPMRAGGMPASPGGPNVRGGDFGFPPPSQGPGVRVGGIPSANSGKQRFYIILGVVLLGLVYLLKSETKTGRTDPGIKTVEELERDQKESEDRRLELVKQMHFKSEDDRQNYERAQRHFLEGFRDYQKGQWVRAMQSFETTRVIYPQHQLATRYYKLAEKQRDEMIALLTLEGRRYREKSMWARCSAQFEKVLDLIPNKDDVKHKTAKTLKHECDEQLAQRFR